MSYNGQPNYSLAPKNLSDFGSMLHDISYDAVHAAGPNSVVHNVRTIPADYQFISWQLSLSSPFSIVPTSGAEKLQGLISGLYMFGATLPKTILYLEYGNHKK